MHIFLKMYKAKLYHVLFAFIFQTSFCQRRIQEGEPVSEDQRYVVYLLKSSVSTQFYDSWLCGGALVSTEFIVTSAACVTDVKHLYAIAGYNKYVNDEDMLTDPCTKEKRKKVVLLCTPKAYELKYEELEVWSFIDIAVVKVESPYNFQDNSYADVCSYTPAPIKINYEQKFQEPGVDAIVLGWGHLTKWRSQGDLNNYNQEELNYAPTLIQNKEDCKKHYEIYNGMGDVIDKYMICTYEKGNINIEGDTILKSPPTAQGCDMKSIKLKAVTSSCEEELREEPGEEIVLIDGTRRDGSNKTRNNTINQAYQLSNDIYKNIVESNATSNYSLIDRIYRNVINSKPRMPTRRQGICQNDHGGPLVTWVGAHEVLIGVASVFKIDENYACIGPYLYTSTQCNGAFLDCILRSDESKTERMRREICDSPPSVKGFELIEKHISWKDHPDGPADNERYDFNKTTNGTALDMEASHDNKTTILDTNLTFSTSTSASTNASANTSSSTSATTTISANANMNASTNASPDTSTDAITNASMDASTNASTDTSTNTGMDASTNESTSTSSSTSTTPSNILSDSIITL